MSTQKAQEYGLLAEFETPADAMHAAEKIRDAGFTRWDVHTPFPIHGMDEAMGLKNSRVGWFSFCGGVTGFTAGYTMIWFMNKFNYPIVVGGKPLFSPMFPFPVVYEMTILLSAFGAIFGMLFLNRLPKLHHPLLKNHRFKGATDDKFYIIIETSDPRYVEEEIRDLFQSEGCNHIELVAE